MKLSSGCRDKQPDIFKLKGNRTEVKLQQPPLLTKKLTWQQARVFIYLSLNALVFLDHEGFLLRRHNSEIKNESERRRNTEKNE